MSRTFSLHPSNDREITVKEFLDALQKMFPFDPDALEVRHCGKRISSFDGVFINRGLTAFDISDEIIYVNSRCVESRALEGTGRSFYVAAACTIAVLTDGTVDSGDGAWHNAKLYRGEELWQEYVTEEQPYNFPKEPFYCPFFDETLDIRAEKVREDVVRRCIHEVVNLPERLRQEICEAAKRLALYFLEKMQRTLGAKFDSDFSPSLPVRQITADTPAGDMLQFFCMDWIVIEPPQQDGQTEYTLQGSCKWAYIEDSEIEMTVRDGRLVYFGFRRGLEPELNGEIYDALNRDREKNFA